MCTCSGVEQVNGRTACRLETQSCMKLDGIQTDAAWSMVYCEHTNGVKIINCPGKKTI